MITVSQFTALGHRAWAFKACTGLAAVCISLMSPCSANDVPLTLERAQRIAAQRAPQLQALDVAAGAARDMAVAAEQRPDPVLKFGLDNVPIEGPDRFSTTRDFMTMRRIGWMQEMTRSEKLELRGERFRTEGRRMLAERTATESQIERDVTLAWIDLAYAERALKLQKSMVDALAAEYRAAEIAYSAARASQADVHTVHSAWLKQRDRAYEAGRRVEAARAMLTRWVGSEVANAPLGEGADWTLVPPTDVYADQAFHPALRVYAVQEEGAVVEEKLAAASARPDWSWEVSYQQRGSAFSNMASIGISIPIPWDRPQRQDREAAARRAMIEQINQQREDALRMQNARLQSALASYAAASARRTHIAPELVNAAARHKEAQQIAYRTATAKLTDVLASRREDLDAQLMALEIEAEQARAWAELRYFAARAPQNPISERNKR